MSPFFRLAQISAAVLAVLALVGCNGNRELHGSNDVLVTPPQTISVFRLAGRLDMQVTGQSAKMVSMRDRSNTVVIYADPSGQAYVNGKAVDQPAGGVTAADGILFVPGSYEQTIRAALRPRPLPRETVAPPAPTPPPAKLTVSGMVVIDAGHGGKDPGARSVRGENEKDIVLEVAQAVAERLAQLGVEARLTRDDDHFIELEERADVANRCRADLFVSIHADSSKNRSADGFTVYVPRLPGRRAAQAADAIGRRLKSAGVVSRGRREANYRVLVRSVSPAVLVELGYLSNNYEAYRLASPAYRLELAEAIANGIVDYLQAN